MEPPPPPGVPVTTTNRRLARFPASDGIGAADGTLLSKPPAIRPESFRQIRR